MFNAEYNFNINCEVNIICYINFRFQTIQDYIKGIIK